MGAFLYDFEIQVTYRSYLGKYAWFSSKVMSEHNHHDVKRLERQLRDGVACSSREGVLLALSLQRTEAAIT